MSNLDTQSEYLNTPQAAELLGISRFYLARLAKQGTIPVAYKGPGRTGAYLFHRSDLEALKASA